MYLKDNFLDKDSQLLKDLRHKELWLDLDEEKTYLSEWWDGTGELDNIWKRLIHNIWGHLDPESYGCFEYWGNILSPVETLNWHQDKNELEFVSTGKTVCANTSTVFYGYPHKLTGGYLEINQQGKQDNLITERIEPVYNRLVVFDPSRWHRVMPIHNGKRYGFQVNIWNTPPLEALNLMDGTKYA
tara:strand:+ start:46991 stop:47548 length:558 start_codon:yes stop_codon:yes gene_type:complete